MNDVPLLTELDCSFIISYERLAPMELKIKLNMSKALLTAEFTFYTIEL